MPAVVFAPSVHGCCVGLGVCVGLQGELCCDVLTVTGTGAEQRVDPLVGGGGARAGGRAGGGRMGGF